MNALTAATANVAGMRSAISAVIRAAVVGLAIAIVPQGLRAALISVNLMTTPASRGQSR